MWFLWTAKYIFCVLFFFFFIKNGISLLLKAIRIGTQEKTQIDENILRYYYYHHHHYTRTFLWCSDTIMVFWKVRILNMEKPTGIWFMRYGYYLNWSFLLRANSMCTRPHEVTPSSVYLFAFIQTTICRIVKI